MADVRIIEVKESVFADNDRKAAELRARNKERGTFLLNLMSSPGSGKTTTLKRTIEALDGRLSIAVMEADIDSDVDARAIAQTGVTSVQVHTGGMCHLDAYMTAEGLEALENEAGAPVDLAILENVGNLVCPAEFDTGASANVMILSVPEGDEAVEVPAHVFDLRRGAHQQDRCTAGVRRFFARARSREHPYAQPRSACHPHKRQDG